ncbi:MAG: response regulator [Halobacteriales archaeon]
MSTDLDFETIRVLHVDDEPDVAETAAAFLEQEHDAIEVKTATNTDDGLEILREHDIDCIVSDYDMPSMDGLEFLRLLRGEQIECPFILYTGKGSEEIASEAVSAGVTDYLQKEVGTDQYTVLANRIENAAAQYRAEKHVKRTQDRFRKLIQHSTDVISIVDAEGRFQYITPSARQILGYTPDELRGEIGFDYVHPEDRPEAMTAFSNAIEDPDTVATVEFRFDHPDEGWIWLENRARNMVDDAIIEGFVVHTRDVTEHRQHEKELERQNDRLEEFVSTVSHDLRNPLNVARGSTELLEQAGVEDEDSLQRIMRAHDRMERIIEDLLALAKEGERVDELEPIALQDVVDAAWETVKTEAATLEVKTDLCLQADTSRLQRLFENLIRNAVEHGGETVTVTIDELTHTAGFYVEDDGPGIPVENRDQVFDSGYTTSEMGTGFGLTIVKEIVAAHDWTIEAGEGTAGGARFEIQGISSVETSQVQPDCNTGTLHHD